MSDRNKAFELQERLQENGISAQTLLDFIINNYSSGSYALGAMQSAVLEFLEEEEDDDEEVDGSSWRDDEDMFDEDEQEPLRVGMVVEVVDEKCNGCVLEYQDVGTIAEIDNNEWFRVVVDGRPEVGNWMKASQLARINY